MMAAILLCGLTLISCVAQDDNAVGPTVPTVPTLPNPLPAVYDVFATLPGNEGDPTVVAALKSIKNVEDLNPL